MTQTDFNDLYQKWAGVRSAEDVVMFFKDREIRLGELETGITRYCALLQRHGVTPGTGVGFSLANSPDVFALFFAIWRSGAYAVPLFPMVPDPMKAGIFSSARVKLVITESARLETLAAETQKQHAGYTVVSSEQAQKIADGEPGAPVPPALPMPAMVAASSGTTGIPKIVMMNRLNISSAIAASAAMAPPRNAAEQEPWRTTIAFPLSTSGMLVCLGLLFEGVQLVFSDSLSPVTFLALTSRWRAQLLSAPPSYFETLCGIPDSDPKSTETVCGIMTGMDFLSPSLLGRLGKRFPGLRYCSFGYGLVETSTVFMVGCTDLEQEDNADTARFSPVEGISNEIAICDEQGNSVPEGVEGELRVRGPSVVKGYAGNPEAGSESFVDGWFRTGDIARLTDAGTIQLLGRNKYLIKRGGKSVSPLTVQNQVNTVAGVLDSAVVGVPHRLYGEMIWAFVVPEDGTEGLEKRIMKSCREMLPNYMVPDAVRFLPQLPRGAGAGKLNVEQLQNIAREELAAMKENTNG